MKESDILQKLRLHKPLEFFIADDVQVATFRDEVSSMEHPFFSLKSGDTKARIYKNGNVTVIITPNLHGLATIFDKDIWIYAISKLQESINNNQIISRTVTFTPYDFFITTHRSTSGMSYIDLKKSLSRLSGTRVQTNIIYSKDDKKTIDFGLIDKWELVKKKRGQVNIGMIEITLPDWLYQRIKKTKVLKINPHYFRIRKAIYRRLYEIAKKHCGNQDEFIISFKKLYLKSGSIAHLNKFKFNIRQLEKTNDLPDYVITYDKKTDNVIFNNRGRKNNIKKNAVKKTKKHNQFSKNISNMIEKNTDIPNGFRG